ncbi:transcriptional regulator [Geobacillus sp. NFOSA3]|uniref:Putative transcriptional regulator n=1 Tax=Geobacillus sp. (strain WCH70) TaxID=471223 RepID=C5D4B3_GEOSW|nr:helix-turn-helix domain-containing protein [Parageobacillus toebii]MED4969693.1 helix-turn-helix domain-containing protein [Parageobacillus toebii]NNU91857.1 transcriptional regulator [Geobacillus sp. NFOSA3]WMT19189.1 helix-turn-helix domain-containing protein [Parageobacillus toebii]
MEQTLKITNVLADPTRYHIYEYITKKHKKVSVQEIAEAFNIHPNVARLHLTKLEDVNMIVSETQKTGKGGRPSRLYRLSDKVIQLHFPFRDYQLLSKIAIQTMAKLGDVGKQALYETGKNFGKELVAQRIPHDQSVQELTFAEKAEIVKEAAEAAGLYPTFEYNEKEGKIYLQVFNCPFKEIAFQEPEIICQMHYAFLQGMFEVLFPNVELVEMENMMKGCNYCSYRANLVK